MDLRKELGRKEMKAAIRVEWEWKKKKKRKGEICMSRGEGKQIWHMERWGKLTHAEAD